MSDAGIVMPNSASTAIIRLTMSSEVRPASLSWSWIDWRPGDRVLRQHLRDQFDQSISRQASAPTWPLVASRNRQMLAPRRARSLA